MEDRCAQRLRRTGGKGPAWFLCGYSRRGRAGAEIPFIGPGWVRARVPSKGSPGPDLIRRLEQPLSIAKEAIDQAGETRRGGVKSRADGVGGRLFQLAGDNGGEQEVMPIC